MTTSENNWDVLVVGAGPAGLATALSASRHGARVLVVERHPGTSIHPRATGVSTRTMEIFRTWGIARAVRDAGLEVAPTMAVTRSLTDPVHSSAPLGYPTPRGALAVSPAVPALCAQDRIEPLLVAEVRRLGGEVRFDTAFTALHIGAGGVEARLQGPDGTRTVGARFVVGADGHRSRVRRALGIGVEELGTLGEYVQALFRADSLTASHGLYAIQHPEAEGVLVPVGDGRWAYARQWYPERGETPDLSPDRWLSLIRAATGVADLQPEILGVLPFTMTSAAATAYRAGPGFVVGDAAHRTTPVGGVGMNTSIHDGHNLGWKLAWVVRGLAGDALLDSYAEERQPIGLRNATLSLQPGAPEPAGGIAGDLGALYRSTVIASHDEVLASGFHPAARPGERAPHAWIEIKGRRVSTLDLFDRGLTVLVGRNSGPWRRAGATVSDVPLTFAEVDVAGFGADGAALVRPDGYVAWRCRTTAANPAAALAGAVDTALGRSEVLAALAG